MIIVIIYATTALVESISVVVVVAWERERVHFLCIMVVVGFVLVGGDVFVPRLIDSA